MQERLKAGNLHLGLDCFDGELLDKTSSWLGLPKTIMTLHIGGTTNGSLLEIAVGVA